MPMNAPSSRVSIKPQQPSKELHLEQRKSTFVQCYLYLITFYIILAMEESPVQPKEDQPSSMSSCGGDRLPSVPLQEPPRDERGSSIIF